MVLGINLCHVNQGSQARFPTFGEPLGVPDFNIS